jgi:AcrR family transcriptional regulator
VVDVSVGGPEIRRGRRRARRGSGDLLRHEILDAATELLLETGQARAVSIRSVAQRVGVTPPSIYLHFEDKDALLDAVCARDLARLDGEMERVAIGQRSTVDVLRAQGLAYVQFALQTPELYRLATMSEWRSGSNVDIALDSSAFRHMRASVQTLMDEGLYRTDDPTTIALELWTVVHGVAAIMVAKPHLSFGDVDGFTDRVFGTVLCGHMVAGLVGANATSEQMVNWVLAHGPGEEHGDDADGDAEGR